MLIDKVSLALFGVELLQLNLAALLTVYVLVALFQERLFHVNFRLLLSCLVLRAYFIAINRSYIIVMRACCIANAAPSLLLVLAPYIYFNLGRLGLLGTALERWFAVAKPSFYEKTASTMHTRIVIIVVFIFIVGFLSALQTWRFLRYKDWMSVIYYVLTTSISSVVTFRLYSQCRREHLLRHENRLQLSERFNTKESMEAALLFLPLSVHELFTSIVFACLFLYSVYFTPFPYGTDTTKLSHFYDNLQAWQSLFAAFYLTIEFRKRRQKYELTDLTIGPEATEMYFDQLKEQWD